MTVEEEQVAMKFQFDCVFYYVTDMDRAVSFYMDILGFKMISRDVVARFDLDGILFEIVPVSDKTKLQGGGNARLCLKVDGIHRVVDELQSKGINTSRIQEVENGFLVSLADPDGNEICLWQYS